MREVPETARGELVASFWGTKSRDFAGRKRLRAMCKETISHCLLSSACFQL